MICLFSGCNNKVENKTNNTLSGWSFRISANGLTSANIINPLIDKQEDFIQEKYILDVYGKAKGE